MAVQIAGIAVGRPGNFPTLNCCFLIFAASSIPLIVAAAASKARWDHSGNFVR